MRSLAPFHPRAAYAPLRAIAEAGLERDAATVRVNVPQTVPATGETVDTWVDQVPQDARLVHAGVGVAQIAAAMGVRAQWLLKMRWDAEAHVGDRVLYRGTTEGQAWERLIEITGDLSARMGVTGRHFAAVDLELGQ